MFFGIIYNARNADFDLIVCFYLYLAAWPRRFLVCPRIQPQALLSSTVGQKFWPTFKNVFNPHFKAMND